MVTSDRSRWQVRSTIQLVGFAVSPADPELVVATTGRRLLRGTDGGRHWQPLQGPALLVVDWADQAGLWGVAADGQVWHSPDAAKTWQRPGQRSAVSRKRCWPTRGSCMRRSLSWASSAQPMVGGAGGCATGKVSQPGSRWGWSPACCG
jgi:hypothetical protein